MEKGLHTMCRFKRLPGRLSLLLPVLLAGCSLDPADCPVCNRGRGTSESEPTPVNLRVVARGDSAAFESLVSGLQEREVPFTLLANTEYATEHCERLGELAAGGTEIVAFAEPVDAEGRPTTLAALSREDQASSLAELQNALETCLGAAVEAAHCVEYTQNADTYALVGELGLDLNLGFVARSEQQSLPGHEDDVLPYEAEEYGFQAVPMHSLTFDGQWLPLSEGTFAGRTSAAEWGDLLAGELDYVDEQGWPLTVELDPSFHDTDPARQTAVLDFVDSALGQGAEFVSLSEYLEWSELHVDEIICEPCLGN
jgi:hypothetical protein